MNKIEELVEKWKENTSVHGTQYTDEQIGNIVMNCMSISKTWFDNNKRVEGESYELALCDDDENVRETLLGVTPKNLPETIIDIMSKSDGSYSVLILNSYMFSNGRKTKIRELGKMDIR